MQICALAMYLLARKHYLAVIHFSCFTFITNRNIIIFLPMCRKLFFKRRNDEFFYILVCFCNKIRKTVFGVYFLLDIPSLFNHLNEKKNRSSVHSFQYSAYCNYHTTPLEFLNYHPPTATHNQSSLIHPMYLPPFC